MAARPSWATLVLAIETGLGQARRVPKRVGAAAVASASTVAPTLAASTIAGATRAAASLAARTVGLMVAQLHAALAAATVITKGRGQRIAFARALLRRALARG